MNVEKGEAVKEQITSLEKTGDEESLLAIKQHLDEVLARIQESKKQAEESVVKAGGSTEVLDERTKEVDEKIEAKTKELSPRRQVVETSFGAFQEFPDKVLHIKDGKMISGPGGNQRFSHNSATGEILPSKQGMLLATAGSAFLKNAFDFDSKLDFNTPIEQFQFKPALVDESGNLIQKGEISLSNGTSQSSEKAATPVAETRPTETRERGADDRMEYQEFGKKFSYFDGRSKTSFQEDSSKTRNIFSFDSGTGRVLPLREGWEYAKTNPSFFLNSAFIVGEDELKTPFDQLRFKPALLDKNGNIVKQGEISVL